MNNTLAFLIRHSYAVLFGVILAEQLGVPVPASPFLIAAGALARAGDANWLTLLALAVGAAAVSQAAWYEAGRVGGRKMLHLICRISLEPDACVRRTEDVFARYGLKSLLVAPFVPGLGLVAQPLAGMTGVSFPRFALFASAGAAVWAGTFLGLGFVLGHPLMSLMSSGGSAGAGLGAVLAIAVGGYLAWKLIQRRILLRRLRIARISPEELWSRLEAGENVSVVDLRHPMEIQVDPRKIPGALQISPDELEHRHLEIPRGQEIILYCS
jgi:membrane protein DedA with SNARE-associated domain